MFKNEHFWPKNGLKMTHFWAKDRLKVDFWHRILVFLEKGCQSRLMDKFLKEGNFVLTSLGWRNLALLCARF